MMRAAVRRDGPGEWSFTVVDDDGAEVLTGVTDCWDDALAGALLEVEQLPAELVAPPARTPGVYVAPRRWWQWVLGI